MKANNNSRREGIMFAGNADRIDEELKEIEEEQAAKALKQNIPAA